MFDDLYLNPVNGENERRGTILHVRIYKCTKLQHTTHELHELTCGPVNWPVYYAITRERRVAPPRDGRPIISRYGGIDEEKI